MTDRSVRGAGRGGQKGLPQPRRDPYTPVRWQPLLLQFCCRSPGPWRRRDAAVKAALACVLAAGGTCATSCDAVLPPLAGAMSHRSAALLSALLLCCFSAAGATFVCPVANTARFPRFPETPNAR